MRLAMKNLSIANTNREIMADPGRQACDRTHGDVNESTGAFQFGTHGPAGLCPGNGIDLAIFGNESCRRTVSSTRCPHETSALFGCRCWRGWSQLLSSPLTI